VTYHVLVRGRTGCLAYPKWEGAGRVARHAKDAFKSRAAAVSFARDRIAPACDYEVRVVDERGIVHYTRRQQPSPTLAGPAPPYVRER
jgi:hypothetical protein